jgi:hypothetical protein
MKGTVYSTVDTSKEILLFRYTDLVFTSRITTCFAVSRNHSAHAVDKTMGCLLNLTYQLNFFKYILDSVTLTMKLGPPEDD